MMPLHGKKIALGVTSSIALYKALELCRLLIKQGAEVRVIMTENAQQLISPLCFASITGQPVSTSMFDPPQQWEMEHIALADWADVLLIAPATANTIGKMAQGIADDLLSTLYLAFANPVFLAPAMNSRMWNHAAVQQNIKKLQQQGVQLLGPEKGMLASGAVGVGRMLEPEQIVKTLSSFFAPSSALGRTRVLITLGPTREWLDAVRFLSNPSSGKMGMCLVQEALRRGARVRAICGPVKERVPEGAECVHVETAEQMLAALKKHAPETDVLIFAAAVADYRPEATKTGKQKKSKAPLSLQLVPTPDCAREMGKRRGRHQLMVGFAAETYNVVNHARHKLRDKKFDLIIANKVDAPQCGFSTDHLYAWMVESGQPARKVGKVTKSSLAALIFDRIEQLLRKQRKGK